MRSSTDNRKMMNLTMSHPVPTFGDSFTITCYVCGMPSSKEWAQKARSRPSTPMRPYFPFLLQVTPVGGAILREDGSTYLCAFCHASLEAQWGVYESQQVVPPPNRKYHIQKFICAVCGVETYRKRIRALPFQEFPFLEKQRQPGSITLGNNPLAVVCLDCSETLWAQSAEYDRWGLPVHKRHFNWMARPPPPEDSVEATVARLPSGETQLPRCPPIEPTLVPPKPAEVPRLLEAVAVSKPRSKAKGDSPKLEIPHIPTSSPQTSRKTSLTSTTPPSLDMVGSFHNQQPPVVTVAPMSSHTTVISLRKDSLSLPPGLIAHQAQGTPGVYPQSASNVYPSGSPYAPYIWVANAGREAGQRTIEPYPYGSTPEALHGSSGAWPWMPHHSSDLLRYQTYVSSLQGRAVNEPMASSRSPSHATGSASTVPYGAAGSPPRHQSSPSCSNMLGTMREVERAPLDDQHQQQLSSRAALARRSLVTGSGSGGSSDDLSHVRKSSPDLKAGKRSPKVLSEGEKSPVNRPRPAHAQSKPHRDAEASTSVGATRSNKFPGSDEKIEGASDDQSVRRECHIPKKRNWQVFMKDIQAVAPADAGSNKEEPKEVQHPKKKKSRVEVSISEDSSVPDNIKFPGKHPRHSPSGSQPGTDSAMDLTVSGGPAPKLPTNTAKSAGAKFRIEYLCQSESSSVHESASTQQTADDTVPRTSVIKCAPKVPSSAVQDDTSQKQQPDNAEVENTSEQALLSNEFPKEEEGGATSKDDKEADNEVPVGIRKDTSQCDDDNEGNSERQDQGSTMNTDDVDERKSKDLPNIEQFLKETVSELVSREKEQEKIQQQTTDKQRQFLNELGLITPEKKIDIEIKSIISRHNRKTLPPLKLRADTKLHRKIGVQLKELLLKVSLEDPALFHGKPEAEKCSFMAELGMKAADKSDKARREVRWRVILMERMRRELRDAATRGVKHEWEKSDILKRFAECDLDVFFNSVSFAAFQDSGKDEDQVVSADPGKGPNQSTENTSSSSGVCINYPTYIPSYATSSTLATNEKSEGLGKSSDTSASEGSGSAMIESILKIPVIPSKRHLQSESSAPSATSDTEDSDDFMADDNVGDNIQCSPSTGRSLIIANDSSPFFVPPQPFPQRVDDVIQSSTAYWEQMRRNIDDILDELESSKEDIPVECKANHVENIREHLRSQLSNIKEMEKRLRTVNRNMLNVSRKKGGRKD